MERECVIMCPFVHIHDETLSRYPCMIAVNHFVPSFRVGDATVFKRFQKTQSMVSGWSWTWKQGMAASTCTRASGRMAFYPRRCVTWGRSLTLIPSGLCWMLGRAMSGCLPVKHVHFLAGNAKSCHKSDAAVCLVESSAQKCW